MLLAVLMAVGAMVGCSDGRPSRVPVSGQVLIDGKPLSYGSVQFVPSGNRASGGVLDSEGRFALSCFANKDGAVVGTHKVLVMASQPLSETKTRWHAPKKYADRNTSGIEMVVSEPTDSMKIELTWDCLLYTSPSPRD